MRSFHQWVLENTDGVRQQILDALARLKKMAEERAQIIGGRPEDDAEVWQATGHLNTSINFLIRDIRAMIDAAGPGVLDTTKIHNLLNNFTSDPAQVAELVQAVSGPPAPPRSPYSLPGIKRRFGS